MEIVTSRVSRRFNRIIAKAKDAIEDVEMVQMALQDLKSNVNKFDAEWQQIMGTDSSLCLSVCLSPFVNDGIVQIRRSQLLALRSELITMPIGHLLPMDRFLDLSEPPLTSTQKW